MEIELESTDHSLEHLFELRLPRPRSWDRLVVERDLENAHRSEDGSHLPPSLGRDLRLDRTAARNVGAQPAWPMLVRTDCDHRSQRTIAPVLCH